MITRTIQIRQQSLPEQEIFDRRLFNVFVVSLPRDGSTLVSKICEHLGVRMIHNSDSADKIDRREMVESKRYGETWRMQPGNQFLEIVANQWEAYLDLFTQPYSGCKLIIPVGGIPLDLLTYSAARVILLKRHPEEIRQSQEASYGRPAERPDLRRAQLRTDMVMQEVMLQNNGIPYHTLHYAALLAEPAEQILRLAEFINAPNAIGPAVDLVDPDRYRFRLDHLEVDA